MYSNEIRALAEKIKNNSDYAGPELLRALNFEDASERFNNFQLLGRMYYEFGDKDKAATYLDRALNILNSINNPFEFSDITREDFFEHYIGINKKLCNPENLIKAYKLLADFYVQKRQFGLAIDRLNQARNAYVDCGHGERYEYDSEVLDTLNNISNQLYDINHQDQDEIEKNVLRKNKQVSIAYIVSGANYPNSAMVRVMAEIAKYSNKSKFKVIFFIVESDYLSENIVALKEAGANVVIPSDFKFSKLQFAIASGKLMQKFNPDIVVVTSILANYEQYIILNWFRSKILVGLCFGPPAQYLPFILDWCISPSYHNLLEAPCGGTLIPLEVGLEIVSPEMRTEVEKLQKEYSRDPESVIMVSAGRAIKFKSKKFWKQIIELLEKSQNLIFILVGVRSLNEVFAAEIDNEIARRIYCVEWTEDYLSYIELADIYIDSYPSGGGFTVIDAMRKGKPTVTFQENYDAPFTQADWSPGSEYLDIPELTAPRGDYELWKKIILKLINNKQYRLALGKKSYDNFLQRLSKPRRMIARYEKVYLDVLKKNKPTHVYAKNHDECISNLKKINLSTFTVDKYSPLYDDFAAYQFESHGNQGVLSNVNIYTKRKNFYSYVMPIVSYLDKLFSLQNFFGIFLIKGSDYLTKDFIYIEDLENTSLSLFTIYQISIQKKVFLMIRNYWLVTGHCIYPDGCDKWKMKCSQCPSLQTSIPLKFDTTRLLFQLKLSLLSRSNIEIIVETEEAKRGLRHSSIIGRKKIHVIEPAIKNNFLKAQDQLTSRDELNIPHDVIVIGIRGAIKKTDKERILNIFSDLPSHQRIYLVTIGAEYVINVINVIHINIKNSDTLDSEDNIILLCNIWIILDYFMGLSRFILKAMCLQKLLISTNLDGVSALLRNPDGGIVIPSKQFLNVKSAIIYLLGNLIEIASYGEAAAKVAQDHYQQDNFRTSIAQLLLESN